MKMIEITLKEHSLERYALSVRKNADTDEKRFPEVMFLNDDMSLDEAERVINDVIDWYGRGNCKITECGYWDIPF